MICLFSAVLMLSLLVWWFCIPHIFVGKAAKWVGYLFKVMNLIDFLRETSIVLPALKRQIGAMD